MAELLAEAPRFFGYYNLILIGRAFLSTALLAFAANALGLVVGFALAILRTERIVRFAPLRWVATAYVEIFRRIPFLVMLMVVFFVFQYSGFDVRGGRVFSDGGVSGFLPVHYSNRRAEIHEETKTKPFSRIQSASGPGGDPG